jgi:HEAT repeat
MLAGLDDVPWADLQHNYGPADDVPGLLQALADPGRCNQAISDLDGTIYHQGGWICPAATAALPFLVTRATDPGIRCRAAIIGLLGNLVAVARTAEPRWVDAGWGAAWQAAHTRLLPLLNDPDPMVRRAATEALSHDIDPAGDALRALRARWDREADPPARLELILAVGDQVSSRTEAEPEAGAGVELAWLRDLTSHPDPAVRLAAALAAHRAAPDAPGARLLIDTLGTAGLGDAPGVAEVWPDIAELVASVGEQLDGDPDSQARLAVLLLGHTEPDRRRGAAQVAAQLLSYWRPPADRLLPLLADHLTDPDDEVRAHAAYLTAAIGHPARASADRLAALLSDTASTELGEHEIGDIALWGLARLGDPRCVPGLVERLTGPRLGFGLASVHVDRAFDWLEPPGIHEVLALVPQHAPELLPALGGRLQTETTLDGRRAFAHAAAGWGAASAPLTPALADLLDSDAAEWAADALGAIGIGAVEAAGRLRALARSRHHDERVRLAAGAAAAQAGGDAEVAVEVIAPALRTSFGATAARHLAGLGPAGAALALALRDLLADRDDWARVEAANALWRVTGDPTEAVIVLTAALEDGVSGHTAQPVARRAARYLAAIGQPAAAAAVPRLRAILADERRLAFFGGWRAFTEDEELRLHAAAALAGATD